MKKQFILLPIICGMITLNAQERDVEIEEINIYGKFLQTPYKNANESTTIISKNEIENSPAKSIDEVLQQFTGLDIRRRGANGVQADISIRGSSFEQVLILINGIRMSDSQTGHNTMNIPIDLANVERIEVVKGPAARRFGQNAYAGVINIITKTSAEENMKISAEGGDFSNYNLGLSTHFGNPKSTNLFQVNTGGSEGYRYNSDYKIKNIFYQNNYKITNGNLGLQAGFSEKKFGANGFYASPLATEQYEEIQTSIVSVNHRQNFGNFGVNSNIYWRRAQDEYLYLRNNPSFYRNMHIGNNVGGEINASYKSTVGVTGIGLELRKEFLVSNNLGERNRFVSQVFFEHHFSLIQNKLQISPGISWANYTHSGNFFYPGLDVGFEVNDHHKIFGNLAKVHRVPTFTDLYYKSKTEIGNPDLDPENAINAEVGYRFQTKNIFAKVSGFIRNSENSIDWVKNSQSALWNAQNVGEINLKGIETEFKQRVNYWLKYSLGYTFLENNYKMQQNVLSKYALENLKHQFVATLDTKFLKNFSNQLIYRYNERVSTGGYHLLDDKVNYQKNNLSIYLIVNNITNSGYSETFGVPMPKRWFHLGFSYDIKL